MKKNLVRVKLDFTMAFTDVPEFQDRGAEAAFAAARELFSWKGIASVEPGTRFSIVYKPRGK